MLAFPDPKPGAQWSRCTKPRQYSLHHAAPASYQAVLTCWPTPAEPNTGITLGASVKLMMSSWFGRKWSMIDEAVQVGAAQGDGLPCYSAGSLQLVGWAGAVLQRVLLYRESASTGRCLQQAVAWGGCTSRPLLYPVC